MQTLLTYWLSYKEKPTMYSWFARVSLFIIYFWFGILKVFSLSPANPLVGALLAKTLPFIPLDTFLVLFGLLEMAIGVGWLVPRFTRLLSIGTLLHLVTTGATLIMVPTAMWQGWWVPTLEGQYVIKNLLIIAAVMGLNPDLTQRVQKGNKH